MPATTCLSGHWSACDVIRVLACSRTFHALDGTPIVERRATARNQLLVRAIGGLISRPLVRQVQEHWWHRLRCKCASREPKQTTNPMQAATATPARMHGSLPCSKQHPRIGRATSPLASDGERDAILQHACTRRCSPHNKQSQPPETSAASIGARPCNAPIEQPQSMQRKLRHKRLSMGLGFDCHLTRGCAEHSPKQHLSRKQRWQPRDKLRHPADRFVETSQRTPRRAPTSILGPTRATPTPC
mmetsp:Transcript_106094/g.298893  ORF Transcript_106094/g.298893 Transcript_106094/m.298893 type:complete len:244 (-) Transcript_106094:241-972(-)